MSNTKRLLYKVCRQSDNRLFSQWSALVVEYQIGISTVAPIGKLFVYNNLEIAKLYTTSDCKLFLAEVDNPIQATAILHSTLANSYKSEIEKFWNNTVPAQYKTRPLRWNQERSVYLADSIKLLEEINETI
jgi:hypothetical protein